MSSLTPGAQVWANEFLLRRILSHISYLSRELAQVICTNRTGFKVGIEVLYKDKGRENFGLKGNWEDGAVWLYDYLTNLGTSAARKAQYLRAVKTLHAPTSKDITTILRQEYATTFPSLQTIDTAIETQYGFEWSGVKLHRKSVEGDFQEVELDVDLPTGNGNIHQLYQSEPGGNDHSVLRLSSVTIEETSTYGPTDLDWLAVKSLDPPILFSLRTLYLSDIRVHYTDLLKFLPSSPNLVTLRVDLEETQDSAEPPDNFIKLAKALPSLEKLLVIEPDENADRIEDLVDMLDGVTSHCAKLSHLKVHITTKVLESAMDNPKIFHLITPPSYEDLESSRYPCLRELSILFQSGIPFNTTINPFPLAHFLLKAFPAEAHIQFWTKSDYLYLALGDVGDAGKYGDIRQGMQWCDDLKLIRDYIRTQVESSRPAVEIRIGWKHEGPA